MTITLCLLVGALIIGIVVAVDHIADQAQRISELEARLAPRATRGKRQLVKPRRPVFAGQIPAPSQALTVELPALDITLEAWDREVEGYPVGYMTDASPVRYDGDTLVPAHRDYRWTYDPKAA